MECMICGSKNLQYKDTIISDFVMSRICNDFRQGNNIKTRLCFCADCTFSFYEYRMTDEEQKRLYDGYRDPRYQVTREKYECWYTEKVNDALNNDSLALQEQQKVIETILSQYIHEDIVSVLDWGGNEGKTITEKMGKEKYVYDISSVPAVKGVTSLKTAEEIGRHTYDLIMCNMLFEHVSDPVKLLQEIKAAGTSHTKYYIEVPSENPFVSDKFSISGNLELFFNPLYSKSRLIKYYFQRKKQPFMPMSEHINFFTPLSLRLMLEKSGFTILDVQENTEKGVLGKNVVLSALFTV